MKHAKHLWALCILLLLSVHCLGNRIDSLDSDDAVIGFIKETFPEYKSRLFYFDRFDVDSITKKTADSLDARNWYKMDVDGNGETDLVVFNAHTSYTMLVVLSDNGHFKMVNGKKEISCHFLYPVLKVICRKPVYLLYHQMKYYNDSAKSFEYTPMEIDTLVYHHGFIVNHLAKPGNYHIEKIEFSNDGMCEGDCPRYEIAINVKANTARCYKELSCDHNPKKFNGHLDAKRIASILSLLQYANFPDLQNAYEAFATDQPTTTLTITYNGGKKKVIQDYGSEGNFTLSEIYQLAYNIKWVPMK